MVDLLFSNGLLLCFAILALGMTIGAVRIRGVCLGSSGVLFAALLVGHFGRDSGWSMPDKIGTVGLVLFVYAVPR